MAKQYSAESIELLEYPDCVRKRPDMYLGATSGQNPPALYRMFREVLDNSLDEYLIGVNKHIVIKLNTKTNEYTIIDNGRGVPSDINPKTGKNALFMAFGQLHASGKFSKDSYKVSSGKNGVGSSCTNALSSSFIAYSNNNKAGEWVSQAFKKGLPIGDVKADKPKDRSFVKKNGTIVKFIPDTSVFENVKPDINRIKKEIKDIQYLCPKLKISLYVDDVLEEYYSEKGISELVGEEEQFPIFTYTAENIDVALNFTTKDSNTFRSYVNLVYTDMGGTHLNGLRKSICNIIKDKSKQKITNDDILEGVVGIIHYKMSEPQYQSQTKNELTSASAEKDVIEILTPQLEKYFRKNKELTDKIVKYAEKMLEQRNKMKTNKALLKGLDKLSKGAKFISDKFLDADRKKYRNVNDLEMFVVEGDSAGGHFKYAREGFQAALKLRGKVLNATKASDKELFGDGKNVKGNREIQDLIAALGCGILENYDEGKLRFNKLILLCDEDNDGGHITNLILAFLIKYIPQLIKDGHVYIVDAPLFIGNSANYRSYGKTRNEVENDMKKHNIKNYTIIRAKGWGETNAEELSELCLNPKTRKLIQLEWDSTTEEMLEKTMGEDVSFRKDMMGV
ncbi:MAG: ATP-binding protein [Paludibacteraceae bacterium]|nr:ATP-binding protein [Paludibacteraceae bacterium]